MFDFCFSMFGMRKFKLANPDFKSGQAGLQQVVIDWTLEDYNYDSLTPICNRG